MKIMSNFNTLVVIYINMKGFKGFGRERVVHKIAIILIRFGQRKIHLLANLVHKMGQIILLNINLYRNASPKSDKYQRVYHLYNMN